MFSIRMVGEQLLGLLAGLVQVALKRPQLTDQSNRQHALRIRHRLATRVRRRPHKQRYPFLAGFRAIQPVGMQEVSHLRWPATFNFSGVGNCSKDFQADGSARNSGKRSRSGSSSLVGRESSSCRVGDVNQSWASAAAAVRGVTLPSRNRWQAHRTIAIGIRVVLGAGFAVRGDVNGTAIADDRAFGLTDAAAGAEACVDLRNCELHL
jgi:hypothetical protein